MTRKANNRLSPGAQLVRRNLRRPRDLVRKLVIGEAIGEKLYNMVRDRPRGNPGAPPGPEAPARGRTSTTEATPAPASPAQLAPAQATPSPTRPAADESGGSHWSIANIPAPRLPGHPTGDDDGS